MIRKIVILHCILLLGGSSMLSAQSAPALNNLEGTNLIYNEDNAPLPLTSTAQVTSEIPIARMEIKIAENYVSGQDQLLFSDTEEIRGIFSEASGTLLLLSYPAGTGRSPISFQNALRTVAYQNTNETNPQAGLRTLSFQVFDEQNQGSTSPTRNLSVLAVNDAPELLLADDAPVNYVPGSGVPAAVLEGLVVSDDDDNTIESAEVTISEGFKNSEDQLALSTAGGGITVAGSGSRTITLIGSASEEAYQNALRNVEFRNTTIPGLEATSGNRKITVVVNDGDAQSLGTSRFVVVGNTNAPPEINPVAKATTQGTEVAFGRSEFTDQYRDPEGNNSFTGIFIRSKPQYGTLFFQNDEVTNSSINSGLFVAAGEFSDLIYRPADDFTGEDRFLWNASDGANFAANNTAVVITVVPPELSLEFTPVEPISVEGNTEARVPPLALSANQDVPVTVTLSVSNGLITLPATLLTELSFSSGDGTEDPSIVFTGSASVVAYVLSGLHYRPDVAYTGSDELTVSASASSDAGAQTTVAITVVPGNQPFRLSTLETDPLNYTENDPSATLTEQITVEDINDESDARPALAVITINEGYVPGEDSLGFAPLSSIEGIQQDNQLTLTGIGDVASYQAAFRAVTYRNTSDNPTPTKTVTFVLYDEDDSASNTVSRSIIIQPVEDPPQLVAIERFPIYYDVDNSASPVTNTLAVVDPEEDALERVVISFSEGYDPAVDSLYVDGLEGITASWDDAQGVLVLAGENTAQVYTLALRAVRYQNKGQTPDEKPRSVSIQAFDGDVASEPVSRSIELVTNEPPTVGDFEVTTTEDRAYVFTLADFVAHYTNPDNTPVADQPAEIRITGLPADGSLLHREDTLQADLLAQVSGSYVVPAADVDAGLLRYVPPPAFTGPDSMRWNGYDGAETAESDAGILVSVLEPLAITLEQDSLTLCSGATDTLRVTVTSMQTDVSYTWSCVGNCGFIGPDDRPAVAVAPTQSTNYIISVTGSDDTPVVQDTVVVIVNDCSGIALDVPSGFTPNGDTNNDRWVIDNAEVVPSLTVEVFDRNGHSVFRSEDYQNDWDGTLDGEPLPVGTYYYLITRPEGQTLKGALSILR